MDSILKIPFAPFPVVNMLNYTPDSIISKQILKNDSLELVLFAVAAGQNFAKHTTTRQTLVHIVDGAGRFFITDTWHPFMAGDYFYMPENCIHALESDGNFKFLLYLF